MFLIIWIVKSITDGIDERRAGQLRGEISSGGLSTPDAFQRRCGKASSASMVKGIPTLRYAMTAGTVTVSFVGSAPAFQWTRDLEDEAKPDIITTASDTDFALNEIGCK